MSKDKEYGYEMFKVRFVIEKDLHISCLLDYMDKAKTLGELKELSATYFQDHSPKFGGQND